jgi:twinkle protein
MAKTSAADRPVGNDEVVSKGPCPKCGSKNNNVLYADGHEHCFTPGCGHYTKAGGEGGTVGPRGRDRTPDNLLTPDRPDAWEDLRARKLDGKTLRRYGYFQGAFNGKGVQVAPYFDQQGNLVAQKLRLPDKEFPLLKAEGYTSLAECALFGHHVYGDRFDRRLIITEGEIDAMTVAQVLDFKTAVVSLCAGAASAVKNLQANYRWVDRFEEIVLFFDDDEPGREAAEAAAKLFAVGKVRIARIPGFKDANEALKAGKPGDIEAAVYMAKTWRPKGIVNAADLEADMEADETFNITWNYPRTWAKLDNVLRGMVRGEVILHVAGTGSGKSTFLREIIFSLAVPQGVKVGVMSFEDMRRQTQLGILSIKANRDLILEPLPVDQLKALHKEVFGTRRFELFDAETAEWSMDAILGYIRFMAKALECEVVVVDPLSFIIAGSNRPDERKDIDQAAQAIAKLAKELGIVAHVAHHLKRPEGEAHEEGAPVSANQVRGSGGLLAFVSTCIAYERNQQGERPDLIRARIIKNRRAKFTGVASVFRYDAITGRVAETDEEFPERKPKGESKNKKGGFNSSPEADY